MSAPRLLLLSLALLAAGCSKTSTRPGLRLAGPAAVAVYRGFSGRDAANVKDYLAVANERGDDLRILDAVDGTAVLAPGLVMALLVPVVPRPALLAAGGLHDAEPTGMTDLLVVAPAGLAACDPTTPTILSGCLQVVATWTPATAVARAPSVQIGLLAGGEDAEVLSVVVVPVVEDDGAGGWRAVAGRARVVAGLSGGRLLLADYARAATGAAIELVGAAVHALGFDAVSLSGSPRDLLHLYAASPDPVNGVEGVAELDLRGAWSQAPAVRAIAAGAPTTHVLAAAVRPFKDLGATPELDQHDPEVPVRLYAALDPERCGREDLLTCGLAVLDPVLGGPIPDPTGELPAHLPIEIPGTILAIAAVYPPTVGGANVDGTPAPPKTEAALQKQATAVGTRWVSTLAAVSSTTGAVHLVDLARGALARERDVLSTLTSGGQAQVTSAFTSKPETPEIIDQPWLALWDEASGGLIRDPAKLPPLVGMTAGYTATEAWGLTWEGALPNLASRTAQVQSTGAGLAWLAIQSAAGADPAAAPYRGVARLYDPRLYVHVDDIVVVTPDDASPCPNGAFELQVTDFLAPDAALYPGGAVKVAPRPDADQPINVVNGQKVKGDPHCLDAAGRSKVLVTVRAAGLVLQGTSFGYAGRPVARTSATEEAFAVGWTDPSTLPCPLFDTDTWPPPPGTCDQTCRSTCERLFVSRKARRLFYVYEQCAASDTICQDRHGKAALLSPPGFVLKLKPGWLYEPPADGTVQQARGASLQISTSSGQVSSVRRPQVGANVTASVLPAGIATFDRAGATGLEASGQRVLVAYPGNLVLDCSPSQGPVTIYR